MDGRTVPPDPQLASGAAVGAHLPVAASREAPRSRETAGLDVAEAVRTIRWRAGYVTRRILYRLSGRTAACSFAFARQRDHDFQAAFDAWEALRARWPDDAFILSSLIACAREIGRADFAYDLAERALRLHPRDPQVISQVALCQERRGRWAVAAAHWAKVAFKRGSHPVWCHSYVHCLLVVGRLDEAERLARLGRRRYPDHAGFLAMEAMIAAERHRLDDALNLWRDYRSRFPDDPVGWEHYGRTFQAKQNALLDDAGELAIDVVAPETVERHEDAAASALLMRFESLGHDCEFGLVQRRFGAEPLGLLRFNSVTYGDLVTAVANGFSRMGEPDVTELITVGNGEYFVQDRRWGLGMHTFIFEGQAKPDLLFRKLCQRVAYLRDRFLEDLASGRKILVFTHPRLSRDDLTMLHRALRSLGPVKLLYVAFGSGVGDGLEATADGSVVSLGPGLYAGRLSREGRSRSGTWNIAFDEWVDLCGRVLDAAAAAEPDRPHDNEAVPAA